ncbi:hypothetical protein HY989_06320 [Candidatus Micrarchaeota archaeon]|nr:hypothetical protein [Candidatus Micrarchaeota archaeon]
MPLRGGLRGYYLYANLAAAMLFVLVILATIPPTSADGNQTSNQTNQTAPTISNLSISFITNESAVISWDTGQFSSTFVYYRLSGSIDFQNYGFSDSVISHSLTLANLLSNSTYEFVASSCVLDFCSNSSISMFSTIANEFPSPTPTFSPTPSPTPSPQFSPTPSLTPTPTATITPTPTPTSTASTSPSPSQKGQGPPQAQGLGGGVEIAAPNNACDVITANNVLIANVNANYTCYNITASSIIFDCNGYTIRGNTSGYGINISNKNHITIKNCIIQNFSRGISAENSINLTLLNITILNATNFGIYIKNSLNDNVSSITIGNSRPAPIAAQGTNMTGIYIENASNSNFTDISIQRLIAGNTTLTGSPGGDVYGIIYINSQNSNFTNVYIDNLIPGRGILVQTGAGFGHSGNATGVYLANFNTTLFRNLSIYNLLGTLGSRGRNSASGGAGSESSNVFGIYVSTSVNSSYLNISISNLSTGAGGFGGFSSAGNGPSGGNAGFIFGIYFQGAFNSKVQNLAILNLSGAIGGNGGSDNSEVNTGGNGGTGSQSFGIAVQANSINTSILNADIRMIYGGAGGVEGPGGTMGYAGFGGNASFLFIANSNLTIFENAYANSSIGGNQQTPTISGVTFGGIGSGIYLHNSNLSNFNNVSLYNISSGITDIFGMLKTSGIYFSASSFNNITNSTVTIIDHRLDSYDPIADYSIYSEGGSISNVLLNSSFNRSNFGWGDSPGISNLTISWFATVNVSNGSGSVANANVRFYNQTSATIPMFQGTTNAVGQVSAEIAEMTAFGFITPSSICKPQTNNTCFTNHTISVNNSFSSYGSTISFINKSLTVPIFLCSSLQSSTTIQNNVSFNNVCFTLNASNIILDCNNNAIIGNRSGFSIGAYATGKSNITIKNCYISNFSIGIMLNYTNQSFLQNNTIEANIISRNSGALAYGIFLNNSNHNNLTANSATNMTATAVSAGSFPNCNYALAYPFYFYNSSHNIASDLNASLAKYSGYVQDTELSSCAGPTPGGIGLYVANSINNSINYGKFSGNFKSGAEYQSANNSKISNSIFLGNGGGSNYGFSATDSQNSSVINGSFLGNNLKGVYLTDPANFNISIINSSFTIDQASITSPNTTIDNSTFSYGSQPIIINSGANGYWLTRNTIQHSVIAAIRNGGITIGADNGFAIDNLIFNTTGGATTGGIFTSGDNGNFTGNNVTNSSSYGAYFFVALGNVYASGFFAQTALNDTIVTQTSTHNSFLNMTVNRTRIRVDANSNLSIQWFLTLNITNSSGGGIPGASVNISNFTYASPYMISTNADASGLLRNQIITEYSINGTHGYETMCLEQSKVICYSPHTILTSNSTFDDNTTTLNITATQMLQIILYKSASTFSFTVFTLGAAGTNFTTSSETFPGNATENYFFNTTNPNSKLLVPCATASLTNCQNGMGLPAYRIRNTGNINGTIWANLSSSLSGTGIVFCANSTAPAGCGTTSLNPICDLTGEGNLNASAWLKVGGNIGQDSPCFDVNVSLYANYTNVAVGAPISRTLTINGTT